MSRCICVRLFVFPPSVFICLLCPLCPFFFICLSRLLYQIHVFLTAYHFSCTHSFSFLSLSILPFLIHSSFHLSSDDLFGWLALHLSLYLSTDISTFFSRFHSPMEFLTQRTVKEGKKSRCYGRSIDGCDVEIYSLTINLKVPAWRTVD